MPAPKSSTVSARESFLDDASHVTEFADLPADTTPFYEAWLKSLKPSSKPIDSLAPASEFKFEGTLRINCYASGLMLSQRGTLIVGEAGEVYANIFVATAIVDGLLRGDIRASERVELGTTARVIGNIETPALAIQPGAVFEGQCHFLPPLSKADSEQIAQSPADNSTVSRGSLRRTRSKPDKQEKAEPMAVAAGR